MANYNLTQTGDEVQAYIDSIPVIDVAGTLSGSNIVFATNPYTQIAANYAADCGSVLRLTVAGDVYVIRITGYDSTYYTGSVFKDNQYISVEIGESSAQGMIEDANAVALIPVTGTESGGSITLSSNPFTQVQTAVNAGQHVVVRVTVGSDIVDFTMNTYSASVAKYIGTANFLLQEFQFLCNASTATITNRSTANTFSTGESVPNVGIDATPTQNSDNLVKSGGVAKEIAVVQQIMPVTKTGAYIDTSGASVGAETASNNWQYIRHDVSEGDMIIITGSGGYSPRLCAWIGSGNTILANTDGELSANNIPFVAPTGAIEVIINSRITGAGNCYLIKKDSIQDYFKISSVLLGGEFSNNFPTLNSKHINDNLYWAGDSNSECSIIPVYKGQHITLTANSTKAINYALIEGDTLPKSLVHVTGVGMTTLRVVSIDKTSEIMVAEDCFLYLRLNDRTPVKVTISGLNGDVMVISENLLETQGEVAQVQKAAGGEKDLYSANEYQNWASGYVYSVNGTILTSSISSHTDYIELFGADKIVLPMNAPATANDVSVAFYDSDKVFISSEKSVVTPNITGQNIEKRTLVVPQNAVYLRATIYTDFISEWYLKLIYVSDFVPETGEMFVGSPQLKLFPSVSATAQSLNSKTSADLYAEYDSMAALYPEFLKRDADLGSVSFEGVSYDIRSYTLGYNKQTLIDHEPTYDEVIADDDNEWAASMNPRKILLVSGMHGEEHTPTWGLMLAIREILQSNEEWAMYLRSNFIFKIVPCLNPVGWSRCVREDAEGNVLNRDAAYNDAEATYYMNWVNTNKDAFILIDFHGTQGRYAYLPVNKKLPIADSIYKLANKLAAAFYSNWSQYYASIDASMSQYAPYLVGKYSTSMTKGTLAIRMFVDYGVQGFAVETPDDLVTGFINYNDLRNCKLTKDLAINILQNICSLPSLP